VAFNQFDPTKIYETQKEGVVLLQSAQVIAAAVGTDRLVVSAITGKRIRVMGWIAQSCTGTVGSFAFKNGAGGAGFMGFLSVPPITNGLNDKLPITDSGYFETSTSTGLYVDIVTAAIDFTVFYIAYTP
jgi:hypothetical protein